MDDHASITFTRVVHTPLLQTWQIVVCILLFAGLIYFAVWRSRRQSQDNRGPLKLNGK